jgi:hypothetical protein
MLALGGSVVRTGLYSKDLTKALEAHTSNLISLTSFFH